MKRKPKDYCGHCKWKGQCKHLPLPYCFTSKIDYKDKVIRKLKRQVEEFREDSDLYNLTQSRLDEVNRHWKKHHPKADYWPDLARMLEWMIDHIDKEKRDL